MKKTATVAMATLALLTLSTFAAAPAMAAEEGGKEFGNPGVLAIGARTSLNLGWASVSPPQGDSQSAIGFGLSPQAAYFVIEGLSVGGELGFSYTKPSKGDGTTVFSIGPEVGYNAWLVPGTLSIWPQVGVLYSSASESVTSTSGTTSTTLTATTSTFSVVAFVPLLIHPVKHFHFGIGPYFSMDLSSSTSQGGTSADGNKTTALGIRGEIGGWL